MGRENVAISVGYVGLIPSSYPINAIYQWTGGPEEAVLRVALKAGGEVDIEGLKERLRGRARRRRCPEVRLSFEPADIVSEVMSFGSPTPVEVAVSGPSLADDRAFAEKLRDELAEIPVAARPPVRPVARLPDGQRRGGPRAGGLSGVTAEEVARSLVAATSSSRFVVPNYWPDPKTRHRLPGAGRDPLPGHGLARADRDDADPAARADGQLLLRDVAQVGRGRCRASTTATT